jgi:sulfur carrier protein
MSITLNGEARIEPVGISLAALITALGHVPQALATAVNQNFVPRDARATHRLQNGDSVFTFQPITGG